jgi:hypothetical protein
VALLDGTAAYSNCSGDQVKKSMATLSCSTHDEDENCTQGFSEETAGGRTTLEGKVKVKLKVKIKVKLEVKVKVKVEIKVKVKLKVKVKVKVQVK